MPPHPKEVLATKDIMARPSPWVTSFFLPHDSLRVGERGSEQVATQLHQLTGPQHQYAIGTFNTCSRDPIHQSLTDTGGGYILEGDDFPHTIPRPSQLTVFTFHLRTPPGLQFNHKPSIKSKFKFKEPMAASWSSDHSTIYRVLHLCLAIANDLSLAV
jgi:hypothetical protein